MVVAADSIGALSSAAAGAILAEGWSGPQVVVVPMGEAGRGLVRAVADLLGVEPRLAADDTLVTAILDAPGSLMVALEWTGPDSASGTDTGAGPGPPRPPDTGASSAPHGRALAVALTERDRTRGTQPGDEIVLDLSGNRAHDAGAGLLAALGAIADVDLTAGADGLGAIGRLELEPIRDRLAARRLVGVVARDQLALPLLGLRGITSRFGRDAGMDPEIMLRTDAALERFALLVDPEAATSDGSGAHGGLGFAVRALGGRLVTGPDFCASLAGLDQLLHGADLAITGCTVYDFAHRGGEVVSDVAQRSAAALVPCVAIAGEVLLGSREMRTMGVEAAYAVHESSLDRPNGEVRSDELRALATRVARSWTW